MAFTLKDVVPWGRSFAEYTAMFALTQNDLTRRILGCADGPAAFNAELTRQDGRVVSTDPLYGFEPADIRQRIDETFSVVLEQTQQNAHEFVWDNIPDPGALGEVRVAAMETFLSDYPTGRTEGRYVPATLPHLPFDAHSFDLALCSHFLFLYSDQCDLNFHLAAMDELLRIAKEVRVFPLLKLGAEPSPHLEPVLRHLHEGGYDARLVRVPYEFQRGGNQMLQIRTN